MTLYSRSDQTCVALSAESGGCGEPHSRPVTRGAPVKLWALDCPACESVLRGDRKPKILKHKIEGGRVVGQERIPDASPMWGTTPDTVPLTPDEERTNTVRSERGRMQIEMLQALAALRSTGIEVPPEALWLLERELPAGVLQGTVVCANAHDVPAGSAFCPQCGVTMAARAAVEAPAPEPAVDLGRLHPQTLRKMCREAKLPDRGSKDQLIQRLQAA